MVAKAGFWSRLTGSDTPTGTTEDAVKLLRKGNIDSGRELLRRICKHEPANFDAHVLYCFEMSRPPANGAEGGRAFSAADAIIRGSFET